MICYVHDGNVFYWCPGCKCSHHVPFPRWTFNGDVAKPTITPSVRHHYTHPVTKVDHTDCHYFITEGQIQFCSDCAHELKGQTFPLQPIPDDYGLPGRGD